MSSNRGCVAQNRISEIRLYSAPSKSCSNDQYYDSSHHYATHTDSVSISLYLQLNFQSPSAASLSPRCIKIMRMSLLSFAFLLACNLQEASTFRPLVVRSNLFRAPTVTSLGVSSPLATGEMKDEAEDSPRYACEVWHRYQWMDWLNECNRR